MFADQDAHIIAMKLQHHTAVFFIDKLFHDDFNLHGLENLGQEFFGFVNNSIVHYKLFDIFTGRAFVFAFRQRILNCSRYSGGRFYFFIHCIPDFISAFLHRVNRIIPFFFNPVIESFLFFIQLVGFFSNFT